MFLLKWLLGAKDDSEIFSKGVEMFVRWGGNHIILPSLFNPIQPLLFMKFDQSFLESYVPGISQQEYSKLLHGIRFALKHMLDDQAFQPGDTGRFWCIEVLSIQDFLNRLLGQHENLAHVSLTTTRIALPRIIFSSKKQDYFRDLNPSQTFQLNDPLVAQQPTWVLRLKKLWNLLFLVEEIFVVIETQPKKLFSAEYLKKMNEAYQLIFELDVDLKGLVQQNDKRLKYIHQHYVQPYVQKDKERQEFVKDMGYFLGLIISTLGSTKGIMSFGLQAKQLSPQVFTWLSHLIQNIVQYVATKSKNVVESQRLEKLQQNLKKIEKELQDFGANPNFSDKNVLKFLELLQFIHQPNRHQVIKLIRHMAIEHETLVIEVLQWIKYEVIPFGLGLFEELENEMMLEPGSLLGPIEIFSQQIYHALIDHLDFKKHSDLKHLYSQNWFIIREENAYQKWTQLMQKNKLLKMYRKYLEDPTIKPTDLFKLFYEDAVIVDSHEAEKLRKAFQPQVWETLKGQIAIRLSSRLVQIDDQLDSLNQYLEQHQFVKLHSVAYFELSRTPKITYHDLSEVQKANCQRLNGSDKKNAQMKSYIDEIKIQALQTKLREPKARYLWVASTLLIFFQDEYFLVSIKDDEIVSIQIKKNINLECQPPKNVPIFLSGYMIDKLDLSTDGDVPLSKDVARFSLEIDDYFQPQHDPIILQELSADELALYAQGIEIQCKKIENAKISLSAFKALLRAQQPGMQLIRARYYALRGLFKCLMNEYFDTFDKGFLTQSCPVGVFEQGCDDIERQLDERLKAFHDTLHDIWQCLDIRVKNEKINRELPAHARAGYLMHTEDYSSFLNQLLQTFHHTLHQYASPALIAELSSTAAQDKYSHLSYPAQVAMYVHQVLFHLKAFYLSVEKFKKYSLEDLSANVELGHRIMSIAHFFTFQDAVYANHPFNLELREKLLNQFNWVKSMALMLERYANIYALKDQSEYDFLNNFIISQHVMTHFFEKKLIRSYLLKDNKGRDVINLSHRLVGDKCLFDSFKKIKNHAVFKAHRLDLFRIRFKYSQQEMRLKALATTIQSENKAKTKLQYIICHSRIKQLQALLNQKQDAFNQWLNARDSLFFKIMEKNIQKSTATFNPLEDMLSNLLFGKPLNPSQKNRLKEINAKKKWCVNNLEKITQLAMEISQKNKEWLKIVRLFEAQKKHDASFSPDEKWWFDLIKKIMEQAVFQTRPKLEDNEKLSLDLIFTKPAHIPFNLKNLLERLLKCNQGQYYFSESVLTAKDRLIKKILHAHFTDHDISFNFYELELLTQYRDEAVLKLLLEYSQDGYRLRKHVLSMQEQWLLELLELPHPLMPPFFQALARWPIEAVFQLWPIQSVLMRAEVFAVFQKYAHHQTDIARQNVQEICKKPLQEPLKKFELLNFRAQYLKEAHEESREMIRQYAYIDQKKFLYQMYYLTFSSKFFNFLRKGFQAFREKSVQNIAQISTEFMSPILSLVDEFEISLQLRPGLLSQIIEQYLKIFCLSYAQQMSASSLYVPMMIQRRDLLIQKRVAHIQQHMPEPQGARTQELLINSLQMQEQAPVHQQLIFDGFMAYTKLYANILQRKYGLLSHPGFDGKLTEFLEFYMLAQIQHPRHPGYIHDGLFKAFHPHIQAQTQDGFFEAYCFKTFEHYLKPNLHQLAKLNQLAVILDEFQADLSKYKESLMVLEQTYQTKSKNSLSGLYKALVFMPYYYFMIFVYYRFHQLSEIEEKQKQIATLKTFIHDPNVHEVRQIIENFQTFFEQEHVQNILQKRAIPAWHFFYYFMEIGIYFIDCLFAIGHVFGQKSHLWHLTQDESRVDEIKQILKINEQDVKFDYQGSIGMLFKSKNELTVTEYQLFRK